MKLLDKILIVCFIGHVIGAFYLQTEPVIHNKNEKFLKLIYHLLIYSIPFAVIFAVSGFSLQLGLILLFTCAAHFTITLIEFGLYKSGLYKKRINKFKIKEWSIYLVNQSLHIVAILAIAIIFRSSVASVKLIPILADAFRALGAEPAPVLKWLLLILCIYKPVNITFITLFSNYKPDRIENLSNKTPGKKSIDKKTGSIIGFLERILIVIFISIQQFSAIGLILTAKSIARYDNIVKDQDFAEYYLIGTLTSVLFSIVLYWAIFS